MERPCANLKYSELTERIIGVFFDVYNELGFGFLESTYSTAMMLALRDCGLQVARQVAIPVWFRGKNWSLLCRHSGRTQSAARVESRTLPGTSSRSATPALSPRNRDRNRFAAQLWPAPAIPALDIRQRTKKNPWKSVQICGRGFRMRIGYGFDSHELRVRAPLKISGDKRKEIRENPCKSVAKVSA